MALAIPMKERVNNMRKLPQLNFLFQEFTQVVLVVKSIPLSPHYYLEYCHSEINGSIYLIWHSLNQFSLFCVATVVEFATLYALKNKVMSTGCTYLY